MSGDINPNVNSCVLLYNYPSTTYAKKSKNKYFNGDDACYDCTCEAPEDCRWEIGMEEYGTLSNLCCNGKYSVCESKCVEVEIPQFAESATICTGCEKTVTTSWICKEGYQKTQDGKGCEPAACVGYPISNACPEHGTCSECLSGTETKYKLDNKRKRKYGEFENVKLTDAQYDRLKKRYADNCDRYIDDLINTLVL